MKLQNLLKRNRPIQNSIMIKIAAAQISPVYLDKNATVEKACQYIKEASANGASLLVFPEAFIPGYPDWIWLLKNSDSKSLNELYSILFTNSISVPDESTKLVCQCAKENNINIAIGINEVNTESSGSSLYNSILYINNEGIIIDTHRKLIPTGGERTVWSRGSGQTLKVHNTTTGKLGGLICWENYMPLARTILYQQGVQILVSPTWDKSENWIQSMQHIAREGGTYVVSCCMPLRISDIPDSLEFKKLYPEGREWINTGNSCIVAPNGKIIAGPVNSEEKIIYAEFDPKLILASKRTFDVAGHYARPDVFDLSIKK